MSSVSGEEEVTHKPVFILLKTPVWVFLQCFPAVCLKNLMNAGSSSIFEDFCIALTTLDFTAGSVRKKTGI